MCVCVSPSILCSVKRLLFVLNSPLTCVKCMQWISHNGVFSSVVWMVLTAAPRGFWSQWATTQSSISATWLKLPPLNRHSFKIKPHLRRRVFNCVLKICHFEVTRVAFQGRMLVFVQSHGTFSQSGTGRRSYGHLFFRQLRDVVHSSVRLNLGIKMVDDGP